MPSSPESTFKSKLRFHISIPVDFKTDYFVARVTGKTVLGLLINKHNELDLDCTCGGYYFFNILLFLLILVILWPYCTQKTRRKLTWSYVTFDPLQYKGQ